VLVPELASVLSGFGAATADIRRERVHSLGLSMPVDTGALQAMADKLRAEVLDDLIADGVAERDRRVVFEVDLRFKRQISELSIQLPKGGIDDRAIERMLDTFRVEYAKRYGHGSIVLGAPTELVSLRAVGIGRTVRASLDTLARPPAGDAAAAPKEGTRQVQLDRGGATRRVTVFDGAALRPGHHLQGPAVIDGLDTTMWIPPKANARVDDRSTLIVEVQA
jgi:N-methylhydantoinase A